NSERIAARMVWFAEEVTRVRVVVFAQELAVHLDAGADRRDANEQACELVEPPDLDVGAVVLQKSGKWELRRIPQRHTRLAPRVKKTRPANVDAAKHVRAEARNHRAG